jgi:superfamily II DNA/RNA helicase
MACRPRGLVLVPTRELATQIQAVLSPLADATGLTAAAIFGGTPQRPQVAALRGRADIVVACPGRLADLIGQGHCHLGDVEAVVLDEAGQMAGLGFLPVVRRLLEATRPKAGGCCSRPPSTVRWTSWRGVSWPRPARHDVDATAPPAQITRHLLTVTPADRAGVVATLASGEARVLIFTRTRHGARKRPWPGRQRPSSTASWPRARAAGIWRRSYPAAAGRDGAADGPGPAAVPGGIRER